MARGLIASSVLALSVSSVYAQVPAYSLVGSYTLPDSASAWDVGPDGRVWGIVGSSIIRQDALNGSTYTTVGSVPTGTVASFGASFLRMSADGSLIAIGDNNFGSSARVHVLETSALSSGSPTSTISVPSGNFDAAWYGHDLFVTGASASFVPYITRITITDAATPPMAQTVITGIGGGSGGVALRNGQLFTGVGYTGGGLSTGQIRAFNLASLTGSTPVDFTSGTIITTALSAWPLGFDPFGNLLVGGGDAFSGTSDFGYAAVINPSNPADALHLSPAGGGTGAVYGVAFNSATSELLVTANGTAYRYAVPAPSAAVAMTLGGIVAARRRRHG